MEKTAHPQQRSGGEPRLLPSPDYNKALQSPARIWTKKAEWGVWDTPHHKVSGDHGESLDFYPCPAVEAPLHLSLPWSRRSGLSPPPSDKEAVPLSVQHQWRPHRDSELTSSPEETSGIHNSPPSTEAKWKTWTSILTWQKPGSTFLALLERCQERPAKTGGLNKTGLRVPQHNVQQV